MIVIGAVFLALALGILIGASLGESFLVANQRDLIELMADNLERLKEMVRQQERELKRWEEVKPLLLQGFRGALEGKELLLLGRGGEMMEQLEGLLASRGAAVASLPLPPTGGSSEGGEEEAAPLSPEALAALLLSPGEAGAADLAVLGLQLPGGETAPPDCCLLLLERTDLAPGSFYHELWLLLHEAGARVIALLPWEEGAAAPPLPALPPEANLVDNINTFWGQMALLEMLAGEAGGHYGFGGGSKGLLPAGRGDDGGGNGN